MRAAALALAGLRVTALPAAAETVLLHAAGSLRAPFTKLFRTWEACGGARVEAVFGASGTLLGRLMGGERGEVFASANMQHPFTLSQAGRSGAVAPFACNRLCALARPGLDAGRRPGGRLRLESVSQDRCARAGQLRRARRQGAPSHRQAAAPTPRPSRWATPTYCTNAWQAADAVPGARRRVAGAGRGRGRVRPDRAGGRLAGRARLRPRRAVAGRAGDPGPPRVQRPGRAGRRGLTGRSPYAEAGSSSNRPVGSPSMLRTFFSRQ